MGSHIGVLPSGQISAPAQTNKSTEATHFAVRFIVSDQIIIYLFYLLFIINRGGVHEEEKERKEKLNN